MGGLLGGLVSVLTSGETPDEVPRKLFLHGHVETNDLDGALLVQDV